jgi:hypothetical protein
MQIEAQVPKNKVFKNQVLKTYLTLFFICYLIDFSVLDTCVFCFTCERLTLCSSSVFLASCSFGLFTVFYFPMFGL